MLILLAALSVMIGAAAAALTAAIVAGLWRSARFFQFGTPILAALAGGAAVVLMAAMGAARLGITEFGVIDWRPVWAASAAGAGCGLVVALTLGLIRRDAHRTARRLRGGG